MWHKDFFLKGEILKTRDYPFFKILSHSVGKFVKNVVGNHSTWIKQKSSSLIHSILHMMIGILRFFHCVWHATRGELCCAHFVLVRTSCSSHRKYQNCLPLFLNTFSFSVSLRDFSIAHLASVSRCDYFFGLQCKYYAEIFCPYGKVI